MKSNLDPDPTTSGLVHLTRLQSIQKNTVPDEHLLQIPSTSGSISGPSGTNSNVPPAAGNAATLLAVISESASNTSARLSVSARSTSTGRPSLRTSTSISSDAKRTNHRPRSRSRSPTPRAAPQRIQCFHSFGRTNSAQVAEQIEEEPTKQPFTPKGLRREFRANNSEVLFHKYKIRIQQNFFMVLLLMNIWFNGIALGLYYGYDQVTRCLTNSHISLFHSFLLFTLSLIMYTLELL